MSQRKTILAVISFAGIAFAGAVFAAWVDAPAAPPGYGLSGCTPPCEQADFQPVNLSSAPQFKSADVNGTGAFGASQLCLGTASSPDCISDWTTGVGTNYWTQGGTLLRPNNNSWNVSIGHEGEGAKLSVNNPWTPNKTGSAGDAIYAYANSVNAAISAEQGGSGYAIYASGPAITGSPWTSEVIRFTSSNYPAQYGSLFVDMSGVSGGLSLGVAGERSLYVAQGGNVGIGTASPTQGLHLYDASDATGRTNLLLQATTENAYLNFKADGAGVNADATLVKMNSGLLKLNNIGSSVANHLVIDTGGNVGIGTNTNLNLLTLRGESAGQSVLAFQDPASTTQYFQIGLNSINDASFNVYGSGGWRTGAMVIDNDTGTVGIGTTAPDSANGTKLHVAGGIRADAYYTPNVSYYLDPDGVNSGALAGLLSVGSLASSGNITVAGQSVCRADGTNCPSASAPAWGSITGRPAGLDDGDDVGANNYTTGISFSGGSTKTLTLLRSGLADLSAGFTDDGIRGSGTSNYIPKWVTGTLADSIVRDSGSTVYVGGNLETTGGGSLTSTGNITLTGSGSIDAGEMVYPLDEKVNYDRKAGCWWNGGLNTGSGASCPRAVGWLWETTDTTRDLPYTTSKIVQNVYLRVIDIEAADWPAIGTIYRFGSGFNPFNQEILVYNSGGNSLWITVNTSTFNNLRDVFNVPLTLRVRSNDFSAGSGGVIFDIFYDYYYLTWKGVPMGFLNRDL